MLNRPHQVADVTRRLYNGRTTDVLRQ